MSDQPRKRGPKPTGRPRRVNISVTVTLEDQAWLRTLPNVSAWLAEKIETDRNSGATRSATRTASDDPAPIAQQDAENHKQT